MIFNPLYCASFLAAFAAAASLGKRDAKVIKLDLGSSSALLKRDGVSGGSELSIPGYVTTHVKFGSNRDEVELIIDTGSWLSHVFDSNVTCTNGCNSSGVYRSSDSDTVVKSGQKAQSYFGGGSHYFGEFVNDEVEFGGLVISNYSFNDVYDVATFKYGLLGLASPPKNSPNEHIAWAAKHAGVIDKAIFSLHIENLDDSHGSLILGGYDAAKIDGEIHWTSIKNSNIRALLGSVTINGETIPVNRNYTLDTGGNSAFLPQSVYEKFIGSLPPDPKNPDPLTSKRYDRSLTEGKTFTYNLNGVDYEFPLKAILEPNSKGDHAIIILHPGDTAQLGSHLFRYLYLAVDLENELIGLASLKNTTETDIRAF